MGMDFIQCSDKFTSLRNSLCALVLKGQRSQISCTDTEIQSNQTQFNVLFKSSEKYHQTKNYSLRLHFQLQ